MNSVLMINSDGQALRRRRRCSTGCMIAISLPWPAILPRSKHGRPIEVWSLSLVVEKHANPQWTEYYLHEYLLAMWGCPIGEMLDLEKLANRCRGTNRWTFFVTSAPNNIPGTSPVPLPKSIWLQLTFCAGGVSTHANAIAVL